MQKLIEVALGLLELWAVNYLAQKRRPSAKILQYRRIRKL